MNPTKFDLQAQYRILGTILEELKRLHNILETLAFPDDNPDDVTAGDAASEAEKPPI